MPDIKLSDTRYDPERLLRRPKTWGQLQDIFGYPTYVKRWLAQFERSGKVKAMLVNGTKLYYLAGFPDFLGDKKKPGDMLIYLQMVMQRWIDELPSGNTSQETWKVSSKRFALLAGKAQEFSEYCDSKVEPVVESETYEEVEAAD